MIMSGIKRIRFLSASDRINYGDLLFPLIFKKVLEELDNEIIFENYGIVKSDFTHFGALPTKSFKKLESEMESGDKIVIGGGEVLFVNWTTLYAFINPWFRSMIKVKIFRKLEQKLQFANKLLSNNRSPFPFALDASDFNLKYLYVYYSSVGGGSLLLDDNLLRRKVQKRLEAAKIISLRDIRSLQYFSKYSSLKAQLIPDSAILMSRIFSKTQLSTLVKKDLHFNDHLFLQLGINKGPKDVNIFANLIDELSKDLNCRVLLCPIGLAPGHKDDKILSAIKKMKPHFDYVLPENIFEIMYLISNSKFYLGTSLHGAITAMSFMVPAIGLNKKVNKLESYMKTWVDYQYENIEFEKVNYTAIEKLLDLFKSSYSREVLYKQQTLAQNNLESIIND